MASSSKSRKLRRAVRARFSVDDPTEGLPIRYGGYSSRLATRRDTIEVLRFLRIYSGHNTIIAPLARKAQKDRMWAPSPFQVSQVLRITGGNRTIPERTVSRDALGRRLRDREDQRPDALAEPDWID